MIRKSRGRVRVLFASTAPVIAALLIAASSNPCAAAPPPFAELLRESGLEYSAPTDFEALALSSPNAVFPYEHALRSGDGSLEVRYAIRPLSRIDISYQDPHSSAPHPNDLFKMLFDQVTLELAGTRDSFVNMYSPEQILGRFNAQWAAAALFDVDPGFSPDFRYGLLIAIHRDDLADAYVIGLFNDYDTLRTHVDDLERSLRFADSADRSTASTDS